MKSEEINELSKALSEAQAEFTAIPKGDFNPFFKSRYAGLPAVIEAASPILTKHGLSVSQHLGFIDGADVLTTYLMHSSGQYIADTMRLHLAKQDAQSHGSATTYARRYSYMAVLGLVADEDDDGAKASQSPRQQNSQPQVRPKKQAQPARPAKQTDANGEITHNLQQFMLSEVTETAQRAALMKVLGEKSVTLTAVPESRKAEVEKLIGEYGAGRPL